MTFTPHGDRVLIRRDETKLRTAGGLVIPERDADTVLTGTVAAIGHGHHNGAKFIETTTPVGAKVLFGQYTGEVVKLDGEEFLIISERELCGYWPADG